MTTTVRAALSILTLAGFYVVALALLVGLGALSVLAFEGGNETAGGKLAILCLIAFVGIVVALWRVARAKPGAEPGVVLSRQDAPSLWELVTELARAANTGVPDEIRLVPEVNAAVSEDARWLGLVPGIRRLYVGVPLLMGLEVAGLTSVLAHELGHYSRSHTRLAPIAYGGQAAILATVEQLSGSLVGWLLRQYAKFYLLVSASVTRRQELEADELSVRIAGREVAQSALRELPVIDAAWSFYESAYVAPGWEVGVAPTADGFFSGFGEMLAGRSDELSSMRAEAAPAEQSRWDTHPSIAARVAAMETMPSAAVDLDHRPASALVPGMSAAATRLAQDVVEFGDRQRVGWQDLTATAVGQSEQRAADVVYRAAARVAGQPGASLGTVLDLVADGRSGELIAQLGLGAEPTADGATPDDLLGEPHEPPNPLVDPMHAVLGSCAVHAGVSHWRHSWTGPAELVDSTGALVALDELAALAADPTTVAVAREHLAALGVDVQAAGQVGDRATAHGAEILGGIATVEVDGSPHDVVLLDRGLILVPCPKKKDGGKARIEELLSSGSVVELAERHHFLAFEDVRSTTIYKHTPVKLDLTLHSGQTVTFKESWTSETLTKDSGDIFVSLAEELGGPPAPAH